VDNLTQEFLAESFEGLDRMDRCLTELEARPEDAELIGEIFRAVHSIKGATGFLGFTRLERLAHAGEHVIGALRSGRVRATPEVVSGLLGLMDGLRTAILLIEQTGREGGRAEDDDSGMIAMLAGLSGDGPVVEAATQGPGGGSQWNEVSEKTLRIDVEVLNRMMNLVGELVLTRNQMLRAQGDAEGLTELTLRLDGVTADLRQTVMEARMQPVTHLFGKFPRIVRDLALSCGKSVVLEVSGTETGLDKTLLEAIKDPLTHALRNAIDHGIETPEVRMAAGKPRQGMVRLAACHRSGSVVIELSDDGAGISLSRVRAKAIERELVSEAQAAAMSDWDALQMVFLPGFSTSDEVTHVSGRGVGMDVVKSNVERVGGTVEIESREGVGTVVRLRVPLTLAIVPALVVRSGGQCFCLPQSALVELVHVTWHEARLAVERIGEAELYRLRETLLPMVWLDRVLEFDSSEWMHLEHGFYVAVLEIEGRRFGLAVDELMSPEEIVVKALTCGLREVGLFSGATVLGNGGIAMILDVMSLANRAGVHPMLDKLRGQEMAVWAEELKPRFVVFEGKMHGAQAERVAMPIGSVERIEVLSLGAVEYAGGRPLLQYGGTLLPLEDSSGVLAEMVNGRAEAATEMTVLIFRRGTERVGLPVRRVLEVAGGELLPELADESGDSMAIVGERVAMVAGERLQGVA